MVKFDLYRFIDKMDIEDVTLNNRGDYNVLDSGEWISPDLAHAAMGEDFKYGRSFFQSSSDPSTRVAKLVWMEKGRTDARAVGKVSTISGDGVKGKTEVYDTNSSYSEGDELTIAIINDGTDNAGKIGFKPASSGDIVKAICIREPNHDSEGLLHFELKC